MRIEEATTPDQIVVVRRLFQEYADCLPIDLCFQGFAEELAALPGAYAPPHGRLLVVFHEGQAAGCVAFRPAGKSACEMKRLFVRPAYRGHGLGRILASEAISSARSAGYSTMLLDTLRSMHNAIQLYQSLGFAPCAAYYDTPIKGTVFRGLSL